ncbi:MAG: mannose-6-phosphate isomerase, class I [Bacteroidota bacterium]
MQRLFSLQGTLMQYDWGGHHFLPAFLGKETEGIQPYAEYWLGAHPRSSSKILTHEGSVLLRDAIQKNPHPFLGEGVEKKFASLPYLLKILDVANILSIQVHPTLTEAAVGFDREEKAGIPLDAPHRNYKDRNHKPEMLVALSDFWLLHGFKSPEQIIRQLEDVPEFNMLKPLYLKEGLAAIYQFVMEMTDEDARHWLSNLVKREIRKKKENQLTKQEPGWWVAKLFSTDTDPVHIDKALFSIYIMNIVHLSPMESLFQGAGQPHAYMEGQCVELMSNSDNVLRAGLTPKHIDVPELIRLTRFETTIPQIKTGVVTDAGEQIYSAPVDDFSLGYIALDADKIYRHSSSSPEILIITDGTVCVNGEKWYARGEALYILPETTYEMTATGPSALFRAFVP